MQLTMMRTLQLKILKIASWYVEKENDFFSKSYPIGFPCFECFGSEFSKQHWISNRNEKRNKLKISNM